MDFKKEMNKKAQGFTAGTMIAWMIGIILFVILVLAASGAFGSWEEVKNSFFGGSATVDDAVNGCNLACSTNDVNAFCDYSRQIIFEAKGKKETYTCNTLRKRLPKPANLDDCEAIPCYSQPVSCDEKLKASECDGVATTCVVGWVPNQTYFDYQALQSQGKVYKEVKDLTARINDPAQITANKNQGQFCVKTVTL